MTARSSDAGTTAASRVLLRRLLLDHVRPQGGALVLALVLMAVVAASTAALAFLMETILDDVFTAREPTVLYLTAALVMAVFVARGLATYGQAVTMNRVGQRILSDLQKRMFDHLLRADFAYLHGRSSGRLISRFINDVEQMRSAVSDVITAFGRDTLTILFLVGVMIYQDWLLALISFFAFPTAILPLVRIGRRMRRVSSTTQRERADLTALLREVFQGARQVRAYGMEPHERDRANRVIEQIFHLVVRAARTRAAAYPIMETLGGSAIVMVICYGGWQVMDGAQTTGTFFSFVTALLLSYDPLKRVVVLNARLQEGLAAAERVFALLDVRPSVIDRPGARSMGRARGEIVFERVDFSYAPDAPALHDISFTAHAGRTVALVGPSGAGKSSVLNLIPRFFDPDAGRITLDGIDIRDLSLSSLRRQIALVSQDIMLFDDTVAANIRYGSRDAGIEDIRRAAGHAAADEFIAALPEGYDTRVGEQGAWLSGRPAPAHRHRPRHAARRPHTPAGRGHLVPRQRVRTGGTGGARGTHARPDHRGRRTPALHHPFRRHDPCAAGRPHRGIGAPLRPAGPGRGLCPALPGAARRPGPAGRRPGGVRRAADGQSGPMMLPPLQDVDDACHPGDRSSARATVPLRQGRPGQDCRAPRADVGAPPAWQTCLGARPSASARACRRSGWSSDCSRRTAACTC